MFCLTALSKSRMCSFFFPFPSPPIKGSFEVCYYYFLYYAHFQNAIQRCHISEINPTQQNVTRVGNNELLLNNGSKSSSDYSVYSTVIAINSRKRSQNVRLFYIMCDGCNGRITRYSNIIIAISTLPSLEFELLYIICDLSNDVLSQTLGYIFCCSTKRPSTSGSFI